MVSVLTPAQKGQRSRRRNCRKVNAWLMAAPRYFQHGGAIQFTGVCGDMRPRHGFESSTVVSNAICIHSGVTDCFNMNRQGFSE
jgi:hypothetical protein